MPQTISQLYAGHDQAAAAAAALRELGFRPEDIHLVGPGGAQQPDGPALDAAELAAAIAAGRVLAARARIYAPHVAAGQTLLTVHAPFGSAQAAIDAMAGFTPLPAPIAEPPPATIEWDEAAPLSSALQLPVRCDDPTPLSRFWNLPVLTAGRASLSRALGLREILHAPAPLSDAIGLRLLIRNPAPFSALLGLKLLAAPRRRV